METSIRTGETIKEEWDTFSERGIRAEFEKGDEPFYPEDDWGMAERQSEDRGPADSKAEQRKKNTQNQPSKQNQEEDSGINMEPITGKHGKQMENGNGGTTQKGTIAQKSREKPRLIDIKGEAGIVEIN